MQNRRKRRYDDRGRRIVKIESAPVAYYRVAGRPRDFPYYHDYGYEDDFSFSEAIRRLCAEYGGRVGLCVDTKYAFRQLLFNDTQTGIPKRKWIPEFLCERVASPSHNEANDPLEDVFGPEW